MRDRRITKADFRLCSTCLSHSQAGLCLCTLQVISKHPEPTIARLRYSLGGDRPSQTTRLIMSLPRLTGVG
jgi:DTW domain-containing protein YfiP